MVIVSLVGPRQTQSISGFLRKSLPIADAPGREGVWLYRYLKGDWRAALSGFSTDVVVSRASTSGIGSARQSVPRRSGEGGEPCCAKLSAEFLGTFWLVLGGCGSAALAAAFPNVGIGLQGYLLAE